MGGDKLRSSYTIRVAGHTIKAKPLTSADVAKKFLKTPEIEVERLKIARIATRLAGSDFTATYSSIYELWYDVHEYCEQNDFKKAEINLHVPKVNGAITIQCDPFQPDGWWIKVEDAMHKDERKRKINMCILHMLSKIGFPTAISLLEELIQRLEDGEYDRDLTTRERAQMIKQYKQADKHNNESLGKLSQLFIELDFHLMKNTDYDINILPRESHIHFMFEILKELKDNFNLDYCMHDNDGYDENMAPWYAFGIHNYTRTMLKRHDEYYSGVQPCVFKQAVYVDEELTYYDSHPYTMILDFISRFDFQRQKFRVYGHEQYQHFASELSYIALYFRRSITVICRNGNDKREWNFGPNASSKQKIVITYYKSVPRRKSK